MDDDSSRPLPSWKKMFGALLVVLVFAGISGYLLMNLLQHRPIDLRSQTRDAAGEVDRILSEMNLSSSRVERKDEEQKSDEKAVWNSYTYQVNLPAEKTIEDVRRNLATGLAARGVAVEPAPEGNTLHLMLLGCEFARVDLNPAAEPPAPEAGTPAPVAEPTAVAEAPMPTEPAPQPEAPGEPAPSTEGHPTPEAPAEPATQEEAEEPYSPLTPSKPEPGAPNPAPAEKPVVAEEPVQAAAPNGARIAVIVDDGGYGGAVGDSILALDPKLTLSILPKTPRGTELARMAVERGFEVMLHMPMQSEEGGESPLSPLSVTMNPEQIRTFTEEALAQVPGAVGVNNHEGSKFTGDGTAMKAFLQTLKAKSLYFVDSRTSPLTLAADTAKSMGIRSASRDVFLDNDPDRAQIEARFKELLNLARKNGSAIGICHFRAGTAQALAELLNGLEEREGVTLVHVSQLLP